METRLLAPRVLLVLASCLLFLPGLGSRDLWNPDEPRYGEVAREMFETGDLLVPHLNGEVYTHKPPLMFWAMAAASIPWDRVTESAVRLPSALAAIGSVWLLYGLARRLFGDLAALLSVLALATSVKFTWQARTGQIDMLLLFFVLATASFWFRAYLDRRPGLYLAGFATAGLGTLAKGPVALLPLLLGWLVCLWLQGNRSELRSMRLGIGLLVWAGIPLAWLALASQFAGGAFLYELLVTQNVTRYTAGGAYSGTRGHLHPWYYYLTVVPVEFLPWSLVLPSAVRRLRSPPGDPSRPLVGLVIAWALATLVFFSLSPAKRSVYVFQMYPALALLVGGGLSRLSREQWASRRGLGWSLAGLGLLFVSAAVAVAWLGPGRPEAALFSRHLSVSVAMVLGAIGLATFLAAWLAAANRIVPTALALAVAFGLGGLALSWGILPMLDPAKSVKPIADRYLELSGDGERYGFFPAQEAALQFYTERIGTQLPSSSAVGAFLAEPGRAWIFVEEEAMGRLGPDLAVDEVARSGVPGRGYVLLAERSTTE